MKSYKDRVEHLKQEISAIESELRESIYATIRKAADEQVRNRLSTHIFTVKFSEISGKPWDSVFHDWHQSAEMLIKKLDSKRTLDLYDYITSLYEKRTKDDRCSYKYRTIYKCHSFNVYDEVTQVIDGKFIKRIIEKLDGLEQ